MSREVVLKVRGLKMHFTSGRGKRKHVVKAVDGLDFDIYKGEVFGLVGESGCGKTTTGRSIIRLYNPTGGYIEFLGQPIAQGKLNMELMKKMQMIFQDPIASLNPRMTVKEIIAEGLRISGIKNERMITENVHNILRKVGLVPEHASRYPHEFSGGQRQRIGIARALVLKPSFIIADEPISALDVSIQAQVINLLNDLRKEYGITIMFIAHDLSVVKYFCDRIAVMYYGKMVELATNDELFKNPLHPYTRSLLSAVPFPDPNYEKTRKRTSYDPNVHNYNQQKPVLQEITEGHFVLANDEEMANYQRSLDNGIKVF